MRTIGGPTNVSPTMPVPSTDATPMPSGASMGTSTVRSLPAVSITAPPAKDVTRSTS